MNTSRLIVLGVAAAAAIGAGLIAKSIVAKPTVVASAGPTQPAVETVEVLVVWQDIPIGTPIDGQLRWQEWPRDAVSEGFITRDREPDAKERLTNSVARYAIYKGEPLRRSKLVGEGQSFMSSVLPAGRRAIATRISADTSAGGFILPNDFVDVIMTRRDETEGGTGYVTETVLENIKVLAIDQTIQEDENGKKVKVGQTATLELTARQAEIITVAQEMADRLTLALRSVNDAQEVVGAGADYLVSGAGRPGTVRLIKFGEVSEVGARK